MSKNRRKEQWNKEVQEGINYYEYKNDNTYNYYGQLNQRKRIKWKDTKGAGYWINLIIRLILGISLLSYTILRFLYKI